MDPKKISLNRLNSTVLFLQACDTTGEVENQD